MNKSLYSWFLALVLGLLATTTEARAQSETRILVGGGNHDLYVHCNPGNLHCIGTHDRRQATRFNILRRHSSPGERLFGEQVQVINTNVCLNVWGGNSAGVLNLYPCSNNPAPNERFYTEDDWDYFGTKPLGRTSLPSRRGEDPTNRDRKVDGVMLWWNGDGQPLHVKYASYAAWQTWWRFEVK